jgi:hypothetical protein
MSAAADAARAAEEEEVLRILEDRTAAAGARRRQGRAFRHASRRAVPIISALAALRGGGSESTAPGRRAGLPNELHPKFELAESTAVPKTRKIRPKFELTSQSVVIKKALPKLGGPNTYCHYGNQSAPAKNNFSQSAFSFFLRFGDVFACFRPVWALWA